jgi:hypothetical protein
MPCLDGEVILGVDSHADFHAAVLIDPLARVVANRHRPRDASRPPSAGGLGARAWHVAMRRR